MFLLLVNLSESPNIEIGVAITFAFTIPNIVSVHTERFVIVFDKIQKFVLTSKGNNQLAIAVLLCSVRGYET